MLCYFDNNTNSRLSSFAFAYARLVFQKRGAVVLILAQMHFNNASFALALAYSQAREAKGEAKEEEKGEANVLKVRIQPPVAFANEMKSKCCG